MKTIACWGNPEMKRGTGILTILFQCVLAGGLLAAEPNWARLGNAPGDSMLEAYFRSETEKLTEDCLSDIHTLQDWQGKRQTYRRQLFEMLGLDPLPARTPLQATVTGVVNHETFRVEKLHFQSRPGLYVTGNLYVPQETTEPLPAILYVCGHGGVKIDGISCGNKTHYQHHGAWFARNGYVCLTIDTVQLGEIEGIHHGTYREGMWWWNCRGYTSAGVEAWNCIRALDYLQSRQEVDPDRMGITGRSGGGVYSWWAAALDERVQVAVPVAGITSLKNHVVDGCVEGHCDCMFMVNTYRWDFPLLAALVAPRPLLISNTDKDRIFPLDGVVDVYNKTLRIYELYGKRDHIGLQICEGPHKDTQQLRIPAFHWFNRFLKHEDPLIEMTATKLFDPLELRVFDQLPADQKNATIQDSFVPLADVTCPTTPAEWNQQTRQWQRLMHEKVFRGWPSSTPHRPAPEVTQVAEVVLDGVRFAAYDFLSEQPHVQLRVFLVQPETASTDGIQLVSARVLDESEWTSFCTSLPSACADWCQTKTDQPVTGNSSDATDRMPRIDLHVSPSVVRAFIVPRGIGLTAWNPSERKRTQIRRRFMLLGQTRDGMRVWDVARAIAAIRQVDGLQDLPVSLEASGNLSGVALYASLFTPNLSELQLHELPNSHHQGPIFLNVLRWWDLPQAVAMAADRCRVVVGSANDDHWQYPRQVANLLGWPADRLEFRP
jgi:dienelactone hydrolase